MKITHAGLRRIYERDDARGVDPNHVLRIRRIRAELDDAQKPQDLDWPGFRLHPLTGDLRGFWSVRVSGNWRIVFRFVDKEPVDVNLVDYH